ncbi:nitrile hydratase subunit beta [Granulosicoccus sp. 3-233]|uniref:nitrile hydratase subunit beta n=1 Tax=Granulosicoccus sp. 3-233 TaxID=3417969 RepID=UPI003D348D04
MKLQHNLGGLEGLDPVNTEPRVFVEEWEQRIFGIHTAMMALSNHLDGSLPDYDMSQVPSTFESFWTWAHLRQGAENIHPFDYFRLRYYEKWLGGISGFFIEEGYITEEELDARAALILKDMADEKPTELPAGGDPLIDTQVEKYLREGDSPKRAASTAPRFSVGDRVRIKTISAGVHSRLPGNLQGRVAEVMEVYEESYTYFYSTADGLGTPMPVYNLAFKAEDLWDESLIEPGSVYYNDIFEAYIEAA